MSRFLIAALVVLSSSAASGTDTSDEESLRKQALQNVATHDGQIYLSLVEQAITREIQKAWETCGSSTPDTHGIPCIFFVIAADGSVVRLVYPKDVPFVACVASSLETIKIVPKPPRDGWVLGLPTKNDYHERKFYDFEDWRRIFENPDNMQKPLIRAAAERLKQSQVATENDARGRAERVTTRYMSSQTDWRVTALLRLAVRDRELGDKGDFVWEVRIRYGNGILGLVLVGAATGNAKLVYGP